MPADLPVDPNNPWDPLDRAAGLWRRPKDQAFEKRLDDVLNKPFISPKWSGPGIPAGPVVEDQRGLTLPELDLQAKFQRARGLGPWAQEPGAFLDPMAPNSALSRALGSDDVESAARQIALAHAGEALSMHNTGRPDLPTGPSKKAVKKKEVK